MLAAILADAEGNPLFLEERLAEMLEAGMLVRQQGAWRLRETAGQPASALVLPQVLERLVRSRVDRLSPAAAEAIRAASVLGTEFTADLLAATLGVQPSALAAVLDELCASDLVHHEPPQSAKPAFRFRHALIQEATYLGLLRNDRRALHASAARALEAACECQLDEVATVLGRHYAIAEDAGRALRYLELGGDHATDAFANDEAMASFREALAVTGQAGTGGARRPADPGGSAGDDTAGDGSAGVRSAGGRSAGDDTAGDMVGAAVRLHAKLANVLWRTARFDEARIAFKAALGLADAGARPLDPVLRAHLHIRLGRLEMTELRYQEAMAAYDAAANLLGDDVGKADDATVDHWLELMVDGRADLHVMRFEADLALAMLDRARPLLEARGTPARKTAFYRLQTMQRLLRNRLRVDDEDIAEPAGRASPWRAHRRRQGRRLRHPVPRLGTVAARRPGRRPRRSEPRPCGSPSVPGRLILRDLALLGLTLTALRRHDTEAVRALLPRTFAALRRPAATPAGRIAGAMACAAWLAWQDGRPDEVIRLAAEIEQRELSTFGSGAMYRWVYLFPLLAARLRAGELDAAVAAARALIDPSQMLLPDDLTAALTAASESWANGKPAETEQHLANALTLASEHAYF